MAGAKGLATPGPVFQSARAISPKAIASTADACAGSEALTNQGDDECHRGNGARSERGGFESNSGGQDEGEEEEQDGYQQERPFVCSVVPLSLALRELGLASVNLLKVDVEGDELAVLHGIDEEDWPKIQQVDKRQQDRVFDFDDQPYYYIMVLACVRLVGEDLLSMQHVDLRHARGCSAFYFRAEWQ